MCSSYPDECLFNFNTYSLRHAALSSSGASPPTRASSRHHPAECNRQRNKKNSQGRNNKKKKPFRWGVVLFLFVIIVILACLSWQPFSAIDSRLSLSLFLGSYFFVSCLSCGDEGPYPTTHLLLQCRLVL
jgi:hypothetical protein